MADVAWSDKRRALIPGKYENGLFVPFNGDDPIPADQVVASKPPRKIRALNDAGIPAGVMFAPVIPALNDHELENVLEAAKDAGAVSAGYVMLRLPLEIKDLFREWLEENRPDRAKHVMSLVRQMRGGKDYDSQWHLRGRGQGPYADMIAKRFQMAVRKYGLNKGGASLTLEKFRKAPRNGEQLSLL